MSKCLVFVKEPMHKAKHVWMSMSPENIEKVLEGKPIAIPYAENEMIMAAEDMENGEKYYNCTIMDKKFYGTIIMCGCINFKDRFDVPQSSSMNMDTFKKLFPDLMKEG